MVTEFKKGTTDIFWSYRWTFDADSTVLFSNPKSRTNVVYTADELGKILSRSDNENSFIPIPRNVMQSAYEVVENRLKTAA